MKLKLLLPLPLMGILLLGASCNENINLDKAKDIINGTNPAPSAGPPGLAPGEEYTLVPANAGGMGLPAFYVMKYEAKAMLNDESATDATGTGAAVATHKPVSTADNKPWRNIDANDSAAECESLGSGYHLISNLEWMAIARDIEDQDANWTGESVGSGCLFRGYSRETTCGYNSAQTPDSGPSRNTRAKHVISNGSEIFDMSGNVSEWTDWDKDTAGFQIEPTGGCASSELNVVACIELVDADYNTSNGGYTTTEGAGLFEGGPGGRGARRGGDWWSTSTAGVFRLSLNYQVTSKNSFTGFRCVWRP